MTRKWVEGIDISLWQGDVPQVVWDTLYGLGQRVAIIGSAHPRPNPYAEINLLRAERAGFVLGTYVALYPGMAGSDIVGVGRRQCGRMWPRLRVCSVDCEVDGITIEQIRDALVTVKAETFKLAPIYTAYWWWVDHFGNPTDFRSEWLWSAYYDADEDIDFARNPYGGWTLDRIFGEQYAGTVPLGGTNVDRNSFRASLLGLEGNEGDMTVYKMIRPLGSHWTFLAARVGDVWAWKRYLPTQLEVELLGRILGPVEALNTLEVQAIPKIG